MELRQAKAAADAARPPHTKRAAESLLKKRQSQRDGALKAVSELEEKLVEARTAAATADEEVKAVDLAFAAATDILVPVQCEFYALEGLTQLQRIVDLVRRNLNETLRISKVVLTMHDPRNTLTKDVSEEVARVFPNELCATVIPRTVRLAEAPSFGQPITSFDPSSKGAIAYVALAKEISNG
jgi:MinD-like ATPase involved in chromosome partitioning or flagellar assembly